MPRLYWMPSLILLGALGMCLPLPAAADYYRYETDNGSIAFTDDPEQIPARYRDSARPMAEQSLHDWERTTRVEPGAHPKPAPQVRSATPDAAAGTEVVTLDAGHDLDVDVSVRSDEPITIDKRVMRPDPDGKGTVEYTVVRQGDRVLMEVREPVLDWIEP